MVLPASLGFSHEKIEGNNFMIYLLVSVTKLIANIFFIGKGNDHPIVPIFKVLNLLLKRHYSCPLIAIQISFIAYLVRPLQVTCEFI